MSGFISPDFSPGDKGVLIIQSKGSTEYGNKKRNIFVKLIHIVHQCETCIPHWLVEDSLGNQYIADEVELDPTWLDDAVDESSLVVLPNHPSRPHKCECGWRPPNRWRHYLLPHDPHMSEKRLATYEWLIR